MINEKQIFCRIDRIEGIINFKSLKNENQVINEWSFDINHVLDLIDNTCNLIKREEETIIT